MGFCCSDSLKQEGQRLQRTARKKREERRRRRDDKKNGGASVCAGENFASLPFFRTYLIKRWRLSAELLGLEVKPMQKFF